MSWECLLDIAATAGKRLKTIAGICRNCAFDEKI
jgi:hypothetical protein